MIEAHVYALYFPELDEEEEGRLKKIAERDISELPVPYRGEMQMMAFASQYIEKWDNAENCLIVSRVTEKGKFQDAMRSVYGLKSR